MTPQHHLIRAERLLDQVSSGAAAADPVWLISRTLEAIGHALIAQAVESGVPHTEPGTEAAVSAGT